MMLQFDFNSKRCDGGYVGIGNYQQKLTRGRILLTCAAVEPKTEFAEELRPWDADSMQRADDSDALSPKPGVVVMDKSGRILGTHG